MEIDQIFVTLDEFTVQQLKDFRNATGQLSGLLREIGRAAKSIHAEVNRAGLVDIAGETGEVNIQDETVQKLDLYANTQFIRVLRNSVHCAGIASEELDDVLIFDDEASRYAKYICLFDPLDGSSNIDVNVSVGSIFSIYRRISTIGAVCEKRDFLQKGDQQIAAGYIVYGSSTILVYATKRGVYGFTLDPTIGEFVLSHPDVRCPKNGDIYSVNLGNFYRFPEIVQGFLENCQQQKPNLSLRYVGSMVADVHRNLLKGGIFLYPPTHEKPKGKLRLLYECNPMAFILEVAGGEATDGSKRILDITPTHLHQRSPFFIGSPSLMKILEEFLNPTR